MKRISKSAYCHPQLDVNETCIFKCYLKIILLQKSGGKSNYVPVIMMPIYPADQCPFDLECEVQKMKETEGKPTKKAKKVEKDSKDEEKEKEKKKTKKRGFVMQRFTDFDLMSQWQ